MCRGGGPVRSANDAQGPGPSRRPAAVRLGRDGAERTRERESFNRRALHVSLVFGWLIADLSTGASYITSDRARSCRPRWLGDHLAAAAQLRAAITGRTPELALAGPLACSLLIRRTKAALGADQAAQTAERSLSSPPATRPSPSGSGTNIATIAISRRLLTRAWHLVELPARLSHRKTPPPLTQCR